MAHPARFCGPVVAALAALAALEVACARTQTEQRTAVASVGAVHVRSDERSPVSAAAPWQSQAVAPTPEQPSVLPPPPAAEPHSTPPNPADPLGDEQLSAARGERIQGTGRAGERCVEAHNPQGTLSTNCGGTNLAWEYVPQLNFRLEQVEMFTSAAEFALLADDGAGHTGEVLARARFARSNDAGWVIASLDPPVELNAGQRYWLWHSPGLCSIVNSGAMQVYYSNFHGLTPGRWEGPWRGHAYAARMSGHCR